MEVERDIERHCVGDDGANEVAEDEACAWVVEDQFQRHNREGHEGFGINEKGKGEAENDEGGDDDGVGPGKDVAAEVLLLSVKELGNGVGGLTNPSMRKVMEDVRRRDPLVSNTFIASHNVFFSIPAARPSFLGIAK